MKPGEKTMIKKCNFCDVPIKMTIGEMTKWWITTFVLCAIWYISTSQLWEYPCSIPHLGPIHPWALELQAQNLKWFVLLLLLYHRRVPTLTHYSQANTPSILTWDWLYSSRDPMFARPLDFWGNGNDPYLEHNIFLLYCVVFWMEEFIFSFPPILVAEDHIQSYVSIMLE